MTKLYTLFALLFLSVTSIAQKFTQWTFEVSVTTPSLGSGTLTDIGGITNTFATGADSTATGYNTSTYPAQSTASGTAGVTFAVSTVGKQGIIISWDQRHSNTSSKYVLFQYSADGGGTWVTPDLTPANTAGTEQGIDYINDVYFDSFATVFMSRVVDLSAITTINNNPDFQFRMVSVFEPGTNTYVPALDTSFYGIAGTLRYDNVTVGANGILPVRLGAFTANLKNNNDVGLGWSTYYEQGTSHFEVQKATNAAANEFVSIATVNALNTARGNVYSFTDHVVKTPLNYYRLKIVDKDGAVSYSQVVLIKTIRFVSFLVTPNPAHSTLTISHPKAINGAHLQILSGDGRHVASYTVSTDAIQTALNVSGLAKGTYILLYYNNGTTTSARFVKE